MGHDEIKATLLEHNISPSAPRLAVADFVLNTRSHPTADEIRIEVEKRMPSVSLATVYNTLKLFVDRGLIKSVRDPHSDTLRYDCNTKPHFHFYDEEQQVMMDLDPRLLRVAPDFSKLQELFEVSEIEVTVKGRIKDLPKELKQNSKGDE